MHLYGGIALSSPPASCGTATLVVNTNANGTWTQKGSAGTGRSGGVGFSIGNKGYVGTGLGNNLVSLNDFWEYNPATNAWTQKANFGGTPRFGAVGFSLGNKGYIGTGTQWNSTTGSTFTKDFWEYDPATNVWTQKANVSTVSRTSATGFALGGKGYVVVGQAQSGYLSDFWKYNPATDQWIQKSNFVGVARESAAAFTIGNKAYVGTGTSSTSNLNDFWEYDPATDTWTQKANFNSTGVGLVGLSIGSKGYFCTGIANNQFYSSVFLEYNPVTNTWLQKANFAGAPRQSATGFVIGNKAYVGTGYIYSSSPVYLADLWEYDPAISINWSNGSALESLGVSSSGTYTATVTDHSGCSVAATMSVNLPAGPVISINGPASVCAGSTISLTASGAGSYTWDAIAGNASGSVAVVAPVTSVFYNVTGSANGCTATATKIITVNPLPVIAANSGTLCNGQNFTLTASGAGSYLYQGGSAVVAPSVTTTYTVSGVSALGCQGNPAAITVSVLPALHITITGPLTICGGQSATLTASGGTSYSWSNGSTGNSILVNPALTTIYSVNAGGSSSCGGTASRTVAVSAAPVLTTVNSNTLLCPGQASTLTASGANLYLWSTGATSPVIVVNPFVTTDYLLTGINSAGCSKTTTVTQYVAACTGIANTTLKQSGFKIYPNPGNGIVTVESDSFPEQAGIEVYNYTGQLISSETVSGTSIQLNFASQADGIYTLRVMANGVPVCVSKLVKQ